MDIWTYAVAIGLYEILICILGVSPSIKASIILIIFGLMLFFLVEVA